MFAHKQNRRMKDKRQRIAVAWPYAAVYADPSFAASLLQAAANSVGMPYYAPNPIIPQLPVIASPSQMQPAAATNHYPYSYRYSPYQILHRNSTSIPQHSHDISIPQHSLGNVHMYNELLQSPNSPISTLSLSPISETEKVSNCFKKKLNLFKKTEKFKFDFIFLTFFQIF